MLFHRKTRVCIGEILLCNKECLLCNISLVDNTPRKAFPLKRHCFLFVQLQSCVSGCLCDIFLLCFFISILIFRMQLQPILTVLQSKIITKFIGRGKCHEIEKIISDFCFDIKTKLRYKANNIYFSVSFLLLTFSFAG